MANVLAHVYPAVVTSFDKDGSFNFDKSRRHVDWLIDHGLKGLGLLMASGEYQSMSLEEHKAYVKEMVPYAKSRGASVIVGCSRERPEDVVELMENARLAGADAGMVLPSFYYKMTQNELIEHYKYINEHSGLRILLYNNPFTSSEIAPETFDELCKLDHVTALKETSGRIDNMTELIFRAPENVGILCGCDYLLYQAYAMGAIGWISMTANVLPRMSTDFHKAFVEEHDTAKAMELYKKMYPVLNFMERFPKPVQAVKFILDEVIGLDVGTVRRPRYGLSKEEKEYTLKMTQIEKLLKEE